MRKINLAKKSNKKCEHCKYYKMYAPNKVKDSNKFGYCEFHKAEFKYWSSCSHFIWKDKYIGIKLDDTESLDSLDDKYICKRCKRPLTDEESIARGFGKSCYDKHIKELIRQSKRLF